MSSYPDSGSRSARLFERARQVLPGGNSRATIYHAPYPLYAASGSGCRVTDVDGVERVDFVNNYTSLIHGHAFPAVTAAVAEQAARGASFAHPVEAEIQLAELLVGRMATIEQVRFTNSGTEAVMQAIKAARAYTGRTMIAKCEGAYHGSYDYAEVSLDAAPETWDDEAPHALAYARGTPAGVTEEVVVLPFNEPEAAERLLAGHAKKLAAVVVDLMPNRAGLIPAHPAFIKMLAEASRRHGILIVVDEVITFRVGPGGAQEAFGLEGDLTTLGKIIGGGLPIGAVGGRREVMAVFDHSQGKAPLPHAGTFNGNALSMVAGLAAMEALTPAAFERLNSLGERARAQLGEAFGIAGVPGAVTGHGSLFMIHLREKALTNFRTGYKTPQEAALMAQVHRHCLNHGVILSTGGLGVLSTPMGEAEIDLLTEAFLGALRALPQAAAIPA